MPENADNDRPTRLEGAGSEQLQSVTFALNREREAVRRAHSDLQNLVEATDIGALFLDRDLRIKRCTGKVTALFGIAAAPEGQPIGDFAHQLADADLIADTRTVLAERTPIRREVRVGAGSWYDMRLRPYRTLDDKIDGVTITFLDVTERRRVEDALRLSEEKLLQDQRLVELSRDPIFIWDLDQGIQFWNRGSEELYGYSVGEAIGRSKDRLLATEVPGSSFAELRAKLLADGSYSGEVRHRTKDQRWLVIETRIVLGAMDSRRLALESTRDVTERRRFEERQRLLLGELTHRVRNTLAVVQAITHQSLRGPGSPQDLAERLDGRLRALASAHTLLVESEWRGADLATLARSQLAAYATDNPARVRISGEPVTLPADQATPFGLILHELATNAAKHGALTTLSGTVALSWTLVRGRDANVLKVSWREQGGPPPRRGAPAGVGTTLIENGLPRATVRRAFDAGGLTCTIDVPLPAGGAAG